MEGDSKIYTVLPVELCISISCAISIHLTWCGNCAGGAGGGTTFRAAGFRGCNAVEGGKSVFDISFRQK